MNSEEKHALALARPGVTELRPDLRTEEGLALLASILERGTGPIVLDLNNNAIGDGGTAALARALEKNARVTAMNLNRNHVGLVGARALARALERNVSVTSLFLSHNDIGDEGARAFAAALEKNVGLTALDLSFNGIGLEGSRALAIALERNATLTALNLNRVPLGGAGGGSNAVVVVEGVKQRLTDLLIANDAVATAFFRELKRDHPAPANLGKVAAQMHSMERALHAVSSVCVKGGPLAGRRDIGRSVYRGFLEYLAVERNFGSLKDLAQDQLEAEARTMSSFIKAVLTPFGNPEVSFMSADLLDALAQFCLSHKSSLDKTFIVRQLQYLKAYHVISKQDIEAVAAAGTSISAVSSRLLQLMQMEKPPAAPSPEQREERAIAPAPSASPSTQQQQQQQRQRSPKRPGKKRH